MLEKIRTTILSIGVGILIAHLETIEVKPIVGEVMIYGVVLYDIVHWNISNSVSKSHLGISIRYILLSSLFACLALLYWFVYV